MDEKEENGIQTHRLLRGGKFPYVNTLSSRQMESLTAICDAFIPSIQVFSCKDDDGVATFFATSASMTATPENLGGCLSGRVEHPAMPLLRLALWFLSTWYGTFAICGLASLSSKFPYFQSFPQLPRQRREEILRSWSMASTFLHTMMFDCLKYVTFRIFFSQEF